MTPAHVDDINHTGDRCMNISESRGRGDFSQVRDAYDQGRHTLPTHAFDILEVYTPHPDALTLDLGCGTGISSRQLANSSKKVLGYDNSIPMLELARIQPSDGITYVAGDANNLPFKESSFGVVTAFRSLHWFANPEAINGIHRVLKKDSPFFALTTYGTGDFSPAAYRSLLAPYIKKMPMDWRTELHQLYERVISESIFDSMYREEFETVETYSLEQALSYFQSTSIWSLVPACHQEQARIAIRTFLESKITQGKIQRPIKVFVFIATK